MSMSDDMTNIDVGEGSPPPTRITVEDSAHDELTPRPYLPPQHAASSPADDSIMPAPALTLDGLALSPLFSWIPMVKDRKIRTLTAKLRELTDRDQRILATFNVKGGSGKTTLAILLATLLRRVTDETVILLDTNNASGNAAGRVGIDREQTTQLMEVLRYERDFGTFADWIAGLPKTATGLKVIASDAVSMLNAELTREQFLYLIALCKRMCHTLVIDTGNKNLGNPELAAVSASDVPIFVADTGMPESLDVAKTIQIMEDNGFDVEARARAVVLRGEGVQLPHLDPSVPVSYIPSDKHVGQVSARSERNDYVPQILVWEELSRNLVIALLELAIEIYETPIEGDPVLDVNNMQRPEMPDFAALESEAREARRQAMLRRAERHGQEPDEEILEQAHLPEARPVLRDSSATDQTHA